MNSKAAILTEMGKPAPYRESTPLSVETVEIAPPVAGEVLVEVGAAGLCHSDLSVIDGSRPRPMPMVLGHEAAGVVREIGSGVRGLEPGDHVVFSFLPMCGHCVPCASGRPVMCQAGAQANATGELLAGGTRFRARGESIHHHLGVSGFSQFTVCAEESLVKIDSELPLSTAALFGCAVMTGVGAVLNTAQSAPGTSVAVFGMGGVGLASVIGATVVGANPIIAVDRIASKLELAKQVGATHVIDASKQDVIAAIKQITKGGADSLETRDQKILHESTRCAPVPV